MHGPITKDQHDRVISLAKRCGVNPLKVRWFWQPAGA